MFSSTPMAPIKITRDVEPKLINGSGCPVGGMLPGRYVTQQIPFVGINKLAAMKNILTVFRTDLRVKVANNHYLKGIVNYARDCDSFQRYAVGPGYWGTALEYSYDTIFGPFTVNVHWSDFTNRFGVYLSAGYNF